ncbi:Mut7-C RNAse domain-containing protein [Pyxidicoccus caerfyrddinensis]|uniref:Mut7-C RNAse domain-containing protein n=1 Tax=Pyxidicoccus caerfyrddinensis TaxID=2709663 RepID=UPI003B8365CD
MQRCRGGASRGATPGEVQGRVPEGVAGRHSHFRQGPGCQRVFWPGTHHDRMQALVDTLRGLKAVGT